jgi:hypothetical protein
VDNLGDHVRVAGQPEIIPDQKSSTDSASIASRSVLANVRTCC